MSAPDPLGPGGGPGRAARWRWLAWAAPAAAGAVAPPLAVLFSGHTLLWRDTARIWAPLRGLVEEALRGLRLPLWNPHEGCGIPLFAQLQHGVLHPLSLAAAWLAPGSSLDVLVVAHVLLAAVGAALLARRLGASEAGATAAGLAFGLSGYVLSMGANLPYLAGAGSAPWAIAALQAGRGPGGVAVAALAVAATHFAGDPQWALVAAVLGAVMAWEAAGRRGAATAALAIALGTALAAVQLLPTWSFLGETARGRLELPGEERLHWALAPWRLLELAAAGFFQGPPGALRAPVFLQLGDPQTGPSFFASYLIPFVPSVFVGAATLALAAAGASAGRRGRILAGAGLLLLWISLGRKLGAEQLLHRVPLWGSFRYSEKLVGPFTLCVALLAGLGADRLAGSPSRRAAAAAAAAAAVAGALGAGLGAGLGEAGLAALGAGPAAPLARWRLAVGLYHAAAALGGLALLLAAAPRLPPLGHRLGPALAGLVLVQSWAAAPFALHAGDRSARDPRPLARLLGGEEPVRIGTPLRVAIGAGPPGLDEADRAVAVESRMGVAPWAAASRIDQIEAYVPTPPMGLLLAENALRWSWAARRRFALTHLVLREPRGEGEAFRVRPALEGGRPIYSMPDLGFAVWEVPHRPWAAFADRAVAVAGPDEAVRALRATADAGGPEVVVEGPVPAVLARGRVIQAERRAERISIEAEAEGEALLVVNDAFWPGWTARLDGHPVEILRADVLVRAVHWPPGRHRLEMAYEPPEVRAGFAVSAVAAAAVAVAAGLARIRLRRRDATLAG